jgi:5'-3' exonuclease
MVGGEGACAFDQAVRAGDRMNGEQTSIEARPRPCPWCGDPAELLCDGPVIVTDGSTDPDARTCNAPICSRCTNGSPITGIVCSRGRGKHRGCQHISDSIDRCPFCQQRTGFKLGRKDHERELARHIAEANKHRGPQAGERIYILDATNKFHTLYHAVPIAKTMALVGDPPKPLNAVVGWVRTLRWMYADGARYIVPVFDGEGPGWRHAAYETYKSNRKPHDPELVSQWPLVHELTRSLRLPLICEPNTEADDLVAAYVEAAVARGLEVVVISNDKDLMQLVRGEGGPGSVRQLVDRELLGPWEVRAKFGVSPERLGDLLALMGDKTDSIPGVPGIGKQKAKQLLGDGDLERLLAEWSFITPTKTGDLIHRHDANIRLWRKLVALDSDTPLPVPLHELQPWKPSKAALNEFFGRFGFVRWEAAVDRYDGE